MEPYLFYAGPFSQFYMKSFVYDSVKFCCAEQFMMYHKALLFDDKHVADEILAEKRPFMMQKLGRTVKNFDQDLWDSHKLSIVTKGNLAKYSQNPSLKRQLWSTGERIIAEASPYDKIWGIGLDIKKAEKTRVEDWPGLNLMGKALMDVRKRILDS